ncbi:unnamed protein product [Lepeophtheirus salmonis]|uniref:(salmon louse) hypothetical protein n=1 Tax=Lepeophtheirus salmonis TaxID=72036 RepID=A0A7R8D4K9_LEPSM|nr:unnamed protein product [Lepeophtheirus salmonis]CAF3027072.1 unnamed protein product [Lepeophtheirus salmonis]
MAASLLEKIYLWADSSLKLVVVGTRRPRHMMFRDLKYKNTPKQEFLIFLKEMEFLNCLPSFFAVTVYFPGELYTNVSNLNNENRDLTGHTSIGGYTFDGALNEAFEGQQANTIIINLTTMASSISETETLNYLSYQCAKCSQNMAIKALAKGLKDTGILLYSMAIDNGALYKKNKKVGFSSLVDVYEVTDSGEVEVTQYDISEDETSSRSEGDSREHKEGISLKSTVTGILTLLDNANPFLSGQLINGQGIPMKF